MNKELYYHSKEFEIKNKKGKYRITFSGYLTPHHDLFIGHSLCSPLDNFDKKKGRTRANGRAYSIKQSISMIDLFDEYKSETNKYTKAVHLFFIEECNKLLERITNNDKSILKILFPHE